MTIKTVVYFNQEDLPPGEYNTVTTKYITNSRTFTKKCPEKNIKTVDLGKKWISMKDRCEKPAGDFFSYYYPYFCIFCKPIKTVDKLVMHDFIFFSSLILSYNPILLKNNGVLYTPKGTQNVYLTKTYIFSHTIDEYDVYKPIPVNKNTREFYAAFCQLCPPI